MAIALLVGDMHIDNSKSSIANSDSFYEVFKTFGLIKESIYEHKPDYVIFFGDIFNSPYSITTSVMTIISKLIAEIAVETAVLFIVGNHDDVDEKMSKVKIGDRYVNMRASLLAPFTYYENVTVFDSPSAIKIQDGVEIGFIPYSNDIINDIQSIQNRFTRGIKKILMGHFDLADTSYMISKDATELTTVPSSKDLIQKYGYDMVLLGHIHDIQDHNVDGKIVKYIGSCRNVDFRNTGENKGIYLLDFDTFKLTYIDNPYTCIYKTFKTFDSFKKYCMNSDPEKLAKTKIKYVYSLSAEVKEIAKTKNMFKSLQFQKNINGVDVNNVASETIMEFENLVKNDLVTKDNLVDYAISFKEPKNKERALNTLNMLLKNSDRKTE